MLLEGSSKISSAGTEVRYCCPFCPSRHGKIDRKYHLYVHSCDGSCHKCLSKGKNLNGYFVCGRCGVKGKTDVPDTFSVRNPADLAEFFDPVFEAPEAPVLPRKVKPKGLLEIAPESLAYRYLKGRGISDRDIYYYQLKVGTGDRLGYRIVIPNLDSSGEWMYWVARDYTNRSNVVRYIYPPFDEIPRGNQVFNLERIQNSRIFITEGVLSAIRVGVDAVALYGKSFGEGQIQNIAQKGIEMAYCVLDPDAWQENIRLARCLEKFGVEARVVSLPVGQDPADLGREKIIDLAKDAPRWSVEWELSARIWRNVV